MNENRSKARQGSESSKVQEIEITPAMIEAGTTASQVPVASSSRISCGVRESLKKLALGEGPNIFKMLDWKKVRNHLSPLFGQKIRRSKVVPKHKS